jgi:hypothetical protein
MKSYKELAIAITSYLEIIFLTHSRSLTFLSANQSTNQRSQSAVEREMKMLRNLGQVRLLLREMMMMMGIFLDLNIKRGIVNSQ